MTDKSVLEEMSYKGKKFVFVSSDVQSPEDDTGYTVEELKQRRKDKENEGNDRRGAIKAQKARKR